MLEAKERIPNRLDDPREFLNVIAYSEMVRRGMTDLKIMLHYDNTRVQLRKFKKEHGLNGMKRGNALCFLRRKQNG